MFIESTSGDLELDELRKKVRKAEIEVEKNRLRRRLSELEQEVKKDQNLPYQDWIGFAARLK